MEQKLDVEGGVQAVTAAERKVALAANVMCGEMDHNQNKPLEYGLQNALHPMEGKTTKLPASSVTASTLSESHGSDKTGKAFQKALPASLESVRLDSSGQGLTSNQGVKLSDNQHSLKAGLRGPTLLEDFLLREKITHFDHERIPERVVHARGSGAHGYFECTEALTDLTRAAPFQAAGKRTPVFVRFSTVAGSRGSPDTPRDVRGFAVKFYTDEGVWDLVGNNMPVFFIQDAIKFPDLVHAVKPEPHNEIPQAASAHNTFWDFVSLMPESTHMLMWHMSDRAIPRSFRTMEGFGVHTFRFINHEGQSRLVKFHWKPVQGTHSLVWDEAVKISGADIDFNRRDLWEAIEGGNFPEWELGVQVFTEEQSLGWSFDVLDATKIIPEELVPVKIVGRLVLNRNVDNFFCETEQVAFCASHVVPGIDFTNDPLLQGRLFSYLDTQLLRLGGPNFHEIPINMSLAPPHNNQRDGFQRRTVNRGAVSYEPNSLAAGCPFQNGMKGFVSFPARFQDESKVRGNAEKFAEHYAQATLFYESQTPTEQDHIANAFRFELSKVTVPAIRQRMVAGLRNVSELLARQVAVGLGMVLPEAMPRAAAAPAAPEVRVSPALSLMARPGSTSIRTLKIAVMVADGVLSDSILTVERALTREGAIVRFVGPRIGSFLTADGATLEARTSFDCEPGFLFDAVVMPDGAAGVTVLAGERLALEFIRNQHAHCKPMLVLGMSQSLLTQAGINVNLRTGQKDTGIVLSESDPQFVATFRAALLKRRHWEREAAEKRIV